MTHASLFSGIGGAELAAAWMGWTNLFHCETNPFGRRVLEYWFPESKSYEDITKTDFHEWRGGHLSPLFVEEMMGYPLTWIVSPFLSHDGEKKA